MRFLLLLLALVATPAAAQERVNAIQPELVAEGPVKAGGEVELAIVMHTQKGWHGYWQNPGDAGLPMKVSWQLPPGSSVGTLRYPVPERLTIAGLMNYVYERDYAVLVRLKAPANATGTIAVGAEAQWLACTDKVCVPERGRFSVEVAVGDGSQMNRTRFDQWRNVPIVIVLELAHAGMIGPVPVPISQAAAAGDHLQTGMHQPQKKTVFEALVEIVVMHNQPNKAPEATPGSVTPRADARVAPAPVVAHL